MSNWNLEVLEEDYGLWLDENCKCDLIDDLCTCKDFEDWFQDRLEDAVEGIDENDYAEMYG